MKKRIWISIIIMVLGCIASASALELKAGSVRSFDENILTVVSDTGGILTIEAFSGTIPLKPPVSGMEIAAGTTSVTWDGLTYGGEPLKRGRMTLRATLEKADGTVEQAEANIGIRRPIPAVTCCLPAAETFCPDGKNYLRIEVAMSERNPCDLIIASADNPDEIIWHQRIENNTYEPAIFRWNGKNNKNQICPPGRYILTAYTPNHRQWTQQAEVTILGEPIPEPELCVTGSLIPEDLTDDAAVWAALTAPVAVGIGGEGKGLQIRDGKTMTSGKAGNCSCRTVGLAILEICGDGWVKIAVWRQTDGVYTEGYVQEDQLMMIRPNTRYGALLDKKAQTLTVYEYGKRLGTVSVSTGLVTADTPRADTHSGVYLMGTRMADFTREGYTYCYPVRIDGSNLIHQAGFEMRGGERWFEDQLATLGSKASHGCVRVDPRITEENNGINAWWIWTHLPHDTKIIITPDE